MELYNMKTAVEWLVNKILIEVDKYDEECNVIGIEYLQEIKQQILNL
jgi:hypothetical protein